MEALAIYLDFLFIYGLKLRPYPERGEEPTLDTNFSLFFLILEKYWYIFLASEADSMK